MRFFQTHRVRNPFMRGLALIFTLLVAAALLFSAYGGCIDPARTCLGAIAAMVFPFVLIVSGILLLINLWLFRISAMVTFASLLACAGPILTFCPLNFFRPSVETIERDYRPYIKLMTYNMLNLDDFSNGSCRIGGGNPTLEYVLEQNPDIMVCQEGQPMLKADKKNISASQHALLESRYPYRYLNQRGMGILSRYPFKVKPVEHPDRWSYDVALYEVELPADTLHLFNVHLQSLGLTDGDKALYHDLTSGDPHADVTTYRSTLLAKLTSAFRNRAEQARMIREYIDSLKGTVVVCGDFNDIPGCYAVRTIEGKDLHDTYREAGLGPDITYHADRFYFRIDHILYRGRLEPLRMWAGKNPSSDHYAMISYFRLLPE